MSDLGAGGDGRNASQLAAKVASWPHSITGRIDYVVAACRGKRVLHLGCADVPATSDKLARGTLLHARLHDVAGELYGLDSASGGIALLRQAGFRNLAVADVEALSAKRPFGDVDFDVVVAGEIIEHLSNPGLFLEGAKHYLRHDSVLVITTVNAYCAHRFVYAALRQRESINTNHTAFFSRHTLAQLASKHGYTLRDIRYYSAREYEEHLNRGRFRVLWWTDRLATRFRPMLAEGLVAKFALE